MNIAEWNYYTLIHKTRCQRHGSDAVLAAKKLNRYSIDKATSGKTRLSGYDDYGYIFCSRKREKERREFGVCFAMRNSR